MKRMIYTASNRMAGGSVEGMRETPSAGDRSPIDPLDALPQGSLRDSHLDTLRDSEHIDSVIPLVGDPETAGFTHIDIVLEPSHHFVGWCPDDGQWVRIAHLVDRGETTGVESTIGVYHDETGEPELEYDPGPRPDLDDFWEFVREFIDHTYPESDRLFDRMESVREAQPLGADEPTDERTYPSLDLLVKLTSRRDSSEP